MPILIRIAKLGLWKYEGLTPLESAGNAPLWEAFSVLNYENANAILDSETQKEMNKERNRKRR